MMKRDFRKVMAVLSEVNTSKITLPFPVEKRDIEISFITNNGFIARRAVRIFLPDAFPRPMPVVFIAHYEMKEDDALLNLYLLKGWAVATTTDFKPEYNGSLVDDDMIFNSAALVTVREQPDIDRSRIIVSGGSAGGYMTQMLSILHLGICCSVSFSGITNIPYVMKYFEEANQHNIKEMQKFTPEELQDLYRLLEVLPVPILGAIYGQFAPILEKMKLKSDGAYWKSLSPSCMAKSFSSPILFTHNTSDVLVPIDQLTSRYCYSELGESLPEDFKFGMSNFSEDEELCRSLADVLPPGDLFEILAPLPDVPGETIECPYDITKKFNIVAFDEGVVEADGGHSKKEGLGSINITGYMEAQLKRGAGTTNWLTIEKLELMIERYQGTSQLLPGHEGIDDKLHGSKAMNQKVIVDELAEYSREQGSAYNEVCKQFMNKRPEFADMLWEINEQFKWLEGI